MRSAVRIERSGPDHLGHHRSRHERTRRRGPASRPPTAGSTWAKASSAHSRPATHAVGAAPRRGPGRRSSSGTSMAVRSPSGPMSSARARATASRTAAPGGRAAPTTATCRRATGPSAGVRCPVTAACRSPRMRRGTGGRAAMDEATAPLRARLGEVAPGVGARASRSRADAARSSAPDTVTRLASSPVARPCRRRGAVRRHVAARQSATAPTSAAAAASDVGRAQHAGPSVMARCRRSRSLATSAPPSHRRAAGAGIGVGDGRRPS